MADAALLSRVEDAFRARQSYILNNLATVTLKSVRRLLEEDLQLPKHRLDGDEMKAFIHGRVDEVINVAPPTATGADELPAAGASQQPGKAAHHAGSKSPSAPKAKDSNRVEQQPAQVAKPSKSKKAAAAGGDGDAGLQGGKENPGKDRKQHKPRQEGGKAKRQTAAVARVPDPEDEDEGEEVAAEDDEEEVEEEEEEEEGSGRKGGAKRQKQAAAAAKPEAGGKVVSRRVEKLKAICKKATIGIAPTIYKKNKDEASLVAALEELLDKHSLSIHSDSKAIERVKGRLATQRDLEGIDLGNIVEDGGRRPRRAAAEAARNTYRAMLQPPNKDEDEDEPTAQQDEDVAERDESAGGASGSQGKPKQGRGKLGEASRARHAASSSDEEEDVGSEEDEEEVHAGASSSSEEHLDEEEEEQQQGSMPDVAPKKRKRVVIDDDEEEED